MQGHSGSSAVTPGSPAELFQPSHWNIQEHLPYHLLQLIPSDHSRTTLTQFSTLAVNLDMANGKTAPPLEP